MEEKNKSILTIHQKKILDLICEEKYFTDRYYLAGGTALAEFYLKHRISEDLDFFTEKEEVDSVAITRFFEKNKNKLKIKSFETKKVLGLFSLFFNFEDGKKLKVDFNYYPFPLIEKGLKYKSLKIESIYDIAVDKVHTVVLNPRARDFIDIYFIIKEKKYSFDDLIMKAKAKFDWHISAVELGARFLHAAELKDYPRMIKKIDHREWKQFFIDYAISLKKQIFK
jgi:predicted nucleotidyltransferase component of viral defense system